MPFVDEAVGQQPGRVVYDLRIWRVEDPGPDTLVYERFGLAGAEHRVEMPLASHTTYHWSVRPRFERDGRPRALRWSASYFPDYEPHSDTAEASYRSLLQEGALRDIPCSDPRSGPTPEVPGPASDVAWTPCGCLDAIPKANRFGFVTPD